LLHIAIVVVVVVVFVVGAVSVVALAAAIAHVAHACSKASFFVLRCNWHALHKHYIICGTCCFKSPKLAKIKCIFFFFPELQFL